MARHAMAQDSLECHRKHILNVARKTEKVGMLAELLNHYEAQSAYDTKHVDGLRYRLRNARAQLKAMGGCD